jgi:hypothetical protein
MHLAADITLTIDGASVRLRPSLGAAIRLEARHGFPAIVNGIVGGHTLILKDVIREAGDYPAAVLDALDRIDEIGIQKLAALTAPLLDLVAAMAGYDDDDQDKPAKKGTAKSKAKPVTHADYFAKLFSIGTGWLGWTPAVTWAATAKEIMAAQEGRVDMLNGIFGGGKKGKDAARADMSLDDKIRLTMASLGAKRAA